MLSTCTPDTWFCVDKRQLTLVIMGCAPFFAIALAVLIISITRGEALSQKAYARAGDVATEVFSQQRTVASYSGEEHEVRRYGQGSLS
jgi:ABC-type multidrug transport system fused ATPase/permease subunit